MEILKEIQSIKGEAKGLDDKLDKLLIQIKPTGKVRDISKEEQELIAKLAEILTINEEIQNFRTEELKELEAQGKGEEPLPEKWIQELERLQQRVNTAIEELKRLIVVFQKENSPIAKSIQGLFPGEYETKEQRVILFLNRVFQGVEDREEEVEFLAVKSKTEYKRKFIKLSELGSKAGEYFIKDFLNLNENGYNFYFGVATRKGGGIKENIISIPAFWVDIDCGEEHREAGFESEAEAKMFMEKKWKDFPEPSVIIHSGNGFHLYWILEPPFRIAEDTKEAQMNHFEDIGRGLEKECNGDSGHDITKKMRIPGTYNWKKKRTTAEVIKQNWGLRYSIDSFIQYIPPEEANRKGTPAPVKIEGTGEAVVMETLEKKIPKAYLTFIREGWEKHSKRFGDTPGNPEAFYESHSHLDLAVVKALRKAGYSPGQIKTIFLNESIGERYRRKGDSYLERTIQQADWGLELDIMKKSKKQAIFPYELDKKMNFLNGKLTNTHKEGETSITVTNWGGGEKAIEGWVGQVFSLAGFQKEYKADCLIYRKDTGTYLQVFYFEKVGLWDRGIDLDLMKQVYIGLFNEAYKRRDYFFTIDLRDFIKHYFGRVREEKILEALEDLERGKKYEFLREKGTERKVFFPGAFIGAVDLGVTEGKVGQWGILVNPLYFPSEWDIRKGTGIKGYKNIQLPLPRREKKNLDAYEKKIKEYIEKVLVNTVAFRQQGWINIGVETLFRRVDVKEYELKRRKHCTEIYSRVEKAIRELGLEISEIITKGKKEDVKSRTLKIRQGKRG